MYWYGTDNIRHIGDFQKLNEIANIGNTDFNSQQYNKKTKKIREQKSPVTIGQRNLEVLV